MADRTELLKKSKQYFESNKEVNAMYATTDGNFFYEKHFADSQAKDLKTDVILITRTEYEEANKPKNALFHGKETKAFQAWLKDN